MQYRVILTIPGGTFDHTIVRRRTPIPVATFTGRPDPFLMIDCWPPEFTHWKGGVL
jgi:hypothetical protein